MLGAKASTVFPTTTWSTAQTYTLGQAIKSTVGTKIWEVTTAGTGGTTEPAGTQVGTVVAATGGTAVYTLRSLTLLNKHVFTPANDQPYMTVWKELGDSIFERFTDCKLTAANLEFAAGGDLALSTTLDGPRLLKAYLNACAWGFGPRSGRPIQGARSPLHRRRRNRRCHRFRQLQHRGRAEPGPDEPLDLLLHRAGAEDHLLRLRARLHGHRRLRQGVLRWSGWHHAVASMCGLAPSRSNSVPVEALTSSTPSSAPCSQRPAQTPIRVALP